METSQCPNFEQCPFLTSLLSGGTLMLLRASFQQSLRKLTFFQHCLGRVGALVILTAKPCKGSASQRTALKCKTIKHNQTLSNTMKYNQTQLNKAIELCMNIHGKCECLNVLHQKFTGIFTFHGKKNFPFGRGITELVRNALFS